MADTTQTGAGIPALLGSDMVIRRRDKRDVVAVLTDAFAPFHRHVLDHLEPHFTRVGLGTLGVIGREVSSDRFRERGSFDPEQLRSLGVRFNVRGLVVVSGAIPPGIDESVALDFVSQFTDGPAVSFGVAVPGLPSAVIGWEQPIRELMEHMLSDPRRRRFVFVRGQAGDVHSRDREGAFRAAMAARGLPVHERLVVRGNYSQSDAMQAVSGLIEAGIEFDGIIAANDDMALGAIAALNRHGLSVPRDVIVSGFDDTLSAFDSIPPLTTATLDTAKLAQATAELVIDAVRDDRVLDPALRVRVPSRVVERESSRPDIIERSQDRTSLGHDPASALRRRLWTRWEVSRVSSDVDLEGLADAVVDTLVNGSDAFARSCEPLLRPDREIGARALANWRHLLRVMGSLVVECDPAELSVPGLQVVFEEMEVVNRRLRPIESTAAAEAASRKELQQRLVMHLAACQDSASLWPTLRSGLHDLGLARGWVAVNVPERPGEVRPVFALHDDDLADMPRFAAADLLPDRWVRELERNMNVLVPLRAGDDDVGYMIVDPTGLDLLQLASVASEVGQVLRHAEQVDVLERRASQLHEANQALDDLARVDPLTGLGNRTALFEGLREELANRSDRSGVAVLFFDLDGFKAVNDSFGHGGGDELLRMITARVASILEPGCRFARLGGDEFTIVLRQEAGPRGAFELAEAVRIAIGKPCELEAGTGHVTASIGIAYAPEDGVSESELISRADMAMYEAKTSGKNSVVRYRREFDVVETNS